MKNTNLAYVVYSLKFIFGQLMKYNIAMWRMWLCSDNTPHIIRHTDNEHRGSKFYNTHTIGGGGGVCLSFSIGGKGILGLNKLKRIKCIC